MDLNKQSGLSEGPKRKSIFEIISDKLRNSFGAKVSTLLMASTLAACSGWGKWWSDTEVEKTPEVQRSAANITVISLPNSTKEWQNIEAKFAVSNITSLSYSIVDEEGNSVSEGLLWTTDWEYAISQPTEQMWSWEYKLIVIAEGQDESVKSDDAEVIADIKVVDFIETQITNYNIPETVTIGNNIDLSFDVVWDTKIESCAYNIWLTNEDNELVYLSEWVLIYEEWNCTGSIDTGSLSSGTYSIVLKTTDIAWYTAEQEVSIEVVEEVPDATWNTINQDIYECNDTADYTIVTNLAQFVENMPKWATFRINKISQTITYNDNSTEDTDDDYMRMDENWNFIYSKDVTLPTWAYHMDWVYSFTLIWEDWEPILDSDWNEIVSEEISFRLNNN